MNDVITKTRFAPSPTGQLHLGNIRTALFSALYALKKQGVFVLRIEDTDQARSKTEYIDAIKQDLKWLGIDWQEGPDQDLGNGPYFQSERKAIYDNYYQQLENSGDAYPCFCSERQLSLSRKAQLSSGIAPKYAGTCRNLKPEEISAKLAEGLQPTLRFKIPKDTVISFEDLVKGKQSFQSKDIGDFIIRRANGSASFMFCNAIDDALMGVTHVLRGDDHLTNSPRQLLILQALNLPTPHYAHIALIHGDTESPLSKRAGSLNIQTLRAAGYFPEAIVNYIARLGHYYADNQLMSYQALANHFSLEHLNTSAAKFDDHQLKYWQKVVIASLPADTLWQYFPESVTALIPQDKIIAFTQVAQQNIEFPQEAEVWAQAFFADSIHYDEESIAQFKISSPAFFYAAIDAFKTEQFEFKSAAEVIKQTTGAKGKALFMPLRLAFTGLQHGPDMATIIDLIGKENVITRLQDAAKQAS